MPFNTTLCLIYSALSWLSRCMDLAVCSRYRYPWFACAFILSALVAGSLLPSSHASRQLAIHKTPATNVLPPGMRILHCFQLPYLPGHLVRADSRYFGKAAFGSDADNAHSTLYILWWHGFSHRKQRRGYRSKNLSQRSDSRCLGSAH